MNCPNCKRSNADGMDFCDHCGTPLSAPAAGKRRTEMDTGPSVPQGGKRATAMDEPTSDPYDPFDPFAPRDGGAGSSSQRLPAGPSQSKRRTAFDDGNRGGPPAARSNDPFAPVEASARGGAAGAPAVGRRIVGMLITFDRSPDGTLHVLREGRNTIGRSADADVQILGDDLVSSIHAVVIWRNGRTIMDDEKSQNGTFLNDDDVMEKVDLRDGDIIRVGGTRLMCRLLDHTVVGKLWPVGTRS